jgi:pimeloyl-ACP methyl ester carboxylesterase
MEPMPITPRASGSVRLPDGRMLAWAEWGDPAGPPVVLMHPTPGTRLYCPDNYPIRRTSADLAVRVVTIDRPGFGRSDVHAGRTLAGWADDVAALLDDRGIDRVGVVGISGGGPHAVSFAVHHPDRVTRLGLVCSMAPLTVMGDRLPAEHRAIIELAATDRTAAFERFRERSAWLELPLERIASPEAFPDVERWIVEDPQARSALMAELAEARRQGLDGAAWDRVCLDAPWGFSAADLRTETIAWTGDRDDVIGPEHFAYFRDAVPGVRTVVWHGDGHRTLARDDRWGEVLEAVLAA